MKELALGFCFGASSPKQAGGGDQPLARIRISVERESDGSITGRFTGNVKAVELDGPDVWLTRLHTIRVSDTLDIRSSR